VTSVPPVDLIASLSLLNSFPFEDIDLSEQEVMKTQLRFEQKDVPSPTWRALDGISKKMAEVVKKRNDMISLIAIWGTDLIMGWPRSPGNGC
jgi:hypothetical protein